MALAVRLSRTAPVEVARMAKGRGGGLKTVVVSVALLVPLLTGCAVSASAECERLVRDPSVAGTVYYPGGRTAPIDQATMQVIFYRECMQSKGYPEATLPAALRPQESLVPAVVDHPMVAYVLMPRPPSEHTVNAFYGANTPILCERVRAGFKQMGHPWGALPCEAVQVSMTERSSNAWVAIGQRITQGGVRLNDVVVVGGPSLADCEKLRFEITTNLWPNVPCRPALVWRTTLPKPSP